MEHLSVERDLDMAARLGQVCSFFFFFSLSIRSLYIYIRAALSVVLCCAFAGCVVGLVYRDILGGILAYILAYATVHFVAFAAFCLLLDFCAALYLYTPYP